MNVKTDEILSRIKSLKNLHTDKELAEFLGINANTLYGWRHSNTINYTLILEKLYDEDCNYILKGQIVKPAEIKESQEENQEVSYYKGQVMILKDILSEYIVKK